MKLKIDEISFSYGAVDVLANVTFSVRRGEFVGIVGPNGSGKSTLLRTISNILKPRGGAVLLDGRKVSTMKNRDLAREMALVSQDTQADFEFTVGEFVLMGRYPYIQRFHKESAEDYRIARDAMEATGIIDLVERPITELSGGERQRAFIARALAQDPQILLLDEPTSHLDINHQVEVFDLLKRLKTEKGITILVVLHDLNLASQYCDSLLMLHKGSIFSCGAPYEVLTLDNIKTVYGVDVLVTKDEFTKRPRITLIPGEERKATRSQKRARIHLVAGGGAGIEVLRLLSLYKYPTVVGVLNIRDADQEEALSLGMDVIEERPFSPISEETHLRNIEAMNEAKAIILASIPFGHGNLKNIEAVEYGINKGIPVIIIEEHPIDERDYTEGTASEYYERLKEKGAIVVSEPQKVLEVLDEISSGRSSMPWT